MSEQRPDQFDPEGDEAEDSRDSRIGDAIDREAGKRMHRGMDAVERPARQRAASMPKRTDPVPIKPARPNTTGAARKPGDIGGGAGRTTQAAAPKSAPPLTEKSSAAKPATASAGAARTAAESAAKPAATSGVNRTGYDAAKQAAGSGAEKLAEGAAKHGAGTAAGAAVKGAAPAAGAVELGAKQVTDRLANRAQKKADENGTLRSQRKADNAKVASDIVSGAAGGAATGAAAGGVGAIPGALIGAGKGVISSKAGRRKVLIALFCAACICLLPSLVITLSVTIVAASIAGETGGEEAATEKSMSKSGVPLDTTMKSKDIASRTGSGIPEEIITSGEVDQGSSAETPENGEKENEK